MKPVIGCEVYVSVGDHRVKEKGYYHLILLAKNYQGYKNLVKIVSTAHIEGMYYRPRISHEVLEQYHEGLICSSASMAGEVPRAILAGDMAKVDEVIEWHKKVFGDDYYLEVMLHKTEVPGLSREVYDNQMIYNEVIFQMAEKHGVKVIATNDVHFVRKEDGPVHDRLICLTTNSYIDDPDRMRYTQQEYLKSEDEMLALFPDHPEAIINTLEVLGKVEDYSIDSDPILPVYEIDPAFMEEIDAQMEKYKEVIDAGRCDKKGNYRGDGFCHSVAYLCHLTYKGAHERYGEELNAEQRERIDFELKTISRMGFPDYFLIVQDYIAASRAMGSMVGPGRGSAAGSVVAYCLKITNLDPIRYQLLFERFLNPDRISMPDIDVDFEDLTKAHSYVEKKYGADHVSGREERHQGRRPHQPPVHRRVQPAREDGPGPPEREEGEGVSLQPEAGRAEAGLQGRGEGGRGGEGRPEGPGQEDLPAGPRGRGREDHPQELLPPGAGVHRGAQERVGPEQGRAQVRPGPGGLRPPGGHARLRHHHRPRRPDELSAHDPVQG